MKDTQQLKNVTAIRAAFWAENPGAERRRGSQNAQVTDTRCLFVDWLDAQARAGRISERLAADATL